MHASGEAGPRPLLEISLECLACHIERVHTLLGISEELAVALFGIIVRKAKLTPHVLRLFQATQHEAVDSLIAALNIQLPPPVLPTSCTSTRPGWL